MMHPAFLLLWLFVLGTIVGSFLNVVVYRLPRGMSIAFPGSHCPSCQHPIRWYDNIPIIGWLWLRGHCRDCGRKISFRYPLVEAITGALFLVLAYVNVVQPYSQAMQSLAAKDGIAVSDVVPTAVPTANYFAAYAFQLTLLCVLLVAALIDVDGQRVPRQLFTWTAGIGILWATYWPKVQLLHFLHLESDVAGRETLIVLLTSIVGMLAAFVLRLGIFRCLGAIRPREMGLWNASLALYTVGAFLGWLAVVVIGIAAIVWGGFTQTASQGTTSGWKKMLAWIKPTMVVFEWTFFWCLAQGPLADWIHRHFW